MSNELLQLSALSDIAKAIPKGNTSLVAGVSNQLATVTNEVYNANLNAVISDGGTILDDIIAAVKNAINNGINTIKGVVDNVTSSISALVRNQIANVVRRVNEVATQITDTLTNLLGDVSDAIENAISWLVNKIQGVIDTLANIGDIIAQSIADAIGNIGEFIAGAVQSALSGISAWISGVVNTVGGWIRGVYDSVSRWIANAIGDVSEWVNGAIQTVREAIDNTIATLKSAYDTTKQYILDAIQKIIAFVNATGKIISEWFWKTVGAGAKWFADNVMPLWNNAVIGAQDLVKIGEGVWGYLQAGNFQGAFDIVDKFAKGLGLPAPVKALWSIVSAIAYFWETVHIQFVGLEVAAAKNANIALGLDPVSLDAATQAVYKGKLSLEAYYDNARLAGVTKTRANIPLEAGRPLPTPGQIQQSYLRREIDLETHDALLRSYGFSSDNIELMRQLYHIIPNPSDLIRMGVREAFTPEIAEAFGQYEDFPPQFGEWAEKIGIDLDWAKRYWAAHWDLPSPSMGFEMLHRGVIDDNELKLLLRALDVMPVWREKLLQISYNPLTRVDIRRMYKVGVLNDEQVHRAYLDIGYNEEKATWLSDFTKRYYAPEDQTQLDQFHELARTVYSQAYKRRIISREEYYQYLEAMKYYKDDIELLITLDDYAILDTDKLFDLTDYRKAYKKLSLNAYDEGLMSKEDISMILSDLGYEVDEVELELSLSDYNRSLLIRNVLVSQLHDQYVTFIIDNVQLAEIMGMYNFSSQEVDSLLEVWNIERSLRTKRPSIADLKKFLDKGLISLEDYLNELRGAGYNEKYIPLYQTLLTQTG